MSENIYKVCLYSFHRSWRPFPLLKGIILCTPSTWVAVWGVNNLSQLVVMCAVWCPISTQHWPWKRRTTCIQRAHSWTAACSQWHPQTWRYCNALIILSLWLTLKHTYITAWSELLPFYCEYHVFQLEEFFIMSIQKAKLFKLNIQLWLSSSP